MNTIWALLFVMFVKIVLYDIIPIDFSRTFSGKVSILRCMMGLVRKSMPAENFTCSYYPA